jgi:hypothetical protein
LKRRINEKEIKIPKIVVTNINEKIVPKIISPIMVPKLEKIVAPKAAGIDKSTVQIMPKVFEIK